MRRELSLGCVINHGSFDKSEACDANKHELWAGAAGASDRELYPQIGHTSCILLNIKHQLTIVARSIKR